MVSRLRPLKLNVIFEDSPYQLGQTIDVTVELMANRDVELREGRIDLGSLHLHSHLHSEHLAYLRREPWT